MSDTLVLFLPSGQSPWRWLRVAGDSVTARGDGVPAFDPNTPENAVAVAPAESVTLHWADLPDRSTAQAVAAARLLADDVSVTPIGELHVAIGREAEGVERPIGVVSSHWMRGALATLAAEGIDPDAVIPAPMLLPRPEQGYVRADLGGEGVVRGATSGFADEARLTELVTGGVAPATLGRDELEAAIVGAVKAPTLDLRQGEFARRTRAAVDWALVRRLVWLGVAILAVTLLLSLTEIVKLNLAASSMEMRADALARTALPRGETVNNADRQLGERLTRLRGAGLGFSSTAASVFAAVGATPGAELRALSFDGNGKLRGTVAVQNEGLITDITQRLHRQGFTVTQSTAQNIGGTFSIDLTVSAS
jgi:general secretion pathway protein L